MATALEHPGDLADLDFLEAGDSLSADRLLAFFGDVLPFEGVADVVAGFVAQRRDAQGEGQRADLDVGVVGQLARVREQVPLVLRILVELVDAGPEDLVRVERRPDRAEHVHDTWSSSFLVCSFT